MPEQEIASAEEFATGQDIATGQDMASGQVDWDGLRQSARDVAVHAYVPYSHFPVGAAALVDDGRVVVGCNVENAAYGVTLCAECGVVSSLHATGGGRLVALACVNAHGEVLMPCGRCRQLLWENGGADLVLDTPDGTKPMSEILPNAFDTEDLDRVTPLTRPRRGRP